ncbi:hypothetical protein E2C01_057954 [Portunus trituberculatus]|uniref:Uncharacterized protein n=1 Tax=Portunus trituberculatus TaxID=210409 RepID=A0A5B7H413_PORTR|nr:hypothetical protein [Portunus trituberculatus]
MAMPSGLCGNRPASVYSKIFPRHFASLHCLLHLVHLKPDSPGREVARAVCLAAGHKTAPGNVAVRYDSLGECHLADRNVLAASTRIRQSV